MKIDHCISCGKTEDEAPLIPIRYGGAVYSICPQCLPTLIHAPGRLIGKIPGLKAVRQEPKRVHLKKTPNSGT